MSHHQLNFLCLICIYLIAFAQDTLQVNNPFQSDKKDPKIAETAEASSHIHGAKNQSQFSNLTGYIRPQTDNSITNTKNTIFQTSQDDSEIPESFKMGFYFFIGLSTCALLFILAKVYRMRLSRAERKYGVHGDRSTQELTPLPMAVGDESDNDDHTLFDINKQIRVS